MPNAPASTETPTVSVTVTPVDSLNASSLVRRPRWWALGLGHLGGAVAVVPAKDEVIGALALHL